MADGAVWDGDWVACGGGKGAKVSPATAAVSCLRETPFGSRSGGVGAMGMRIIREYN